MYNVLSVLFRKLNSRMTNENQMYLESRGKNTKLFFSKLFFNFLFLSIQLVTIMNSYFVYGFKINIT